MNNNSVSFNHLTVSQVARILGVSDSVVYRLLKAGKMAYSQHGRAIRISVQSVYDYYRRSHHPRKS